jgi:hypothetical protein
LWYSGQDPAHWQKAFIEQAMYQQQQLNAQQYQQSLAQYQSVLATMKQQMLQEIYGTSFTKLQDSYMKAADSLGLTIVY